MIDGYLRQVAFTLIIPIRYSGSLQVTPLCNAERRGLVIVNGPQLRPSDDTVPGKVTFSTNNILAETVHAEPGVAAITLTTRSDITRANLRSILFFIFIFSLSVISIIDFRWTPHN
jgi:hypothetical protein